MRSNLKYIFCAFSLLLPALSFAQSAGQVACTRRDGYTYLYSSLTTLEVLRTLQCGEQVDITGRYEGYYGVRTAKGEVGYVPEGSLLLLKDKPGPKTPQSLPAQPARPRTAYDEPAPAPPAPHKAIPAGFDLTLPNGTPIPMKLRKTISSATAHRGDQVEFEVSNDVIVDGFCVIPKGALAMGTVSEAEPRKRLGHGGSLSFFINSVLLSDNEKAAVRSFQEGTASNAAAGAINPLAHGKDVVFAQGTEFTAYVDGDVYLKRAAFSVANGGAGATSSAQNPSQPHQR